MFHPQIGRNMEVYMDDMLVKSLDEGKHLDDLQETFDTLRQYNMKLNPSKCTFGVSSGKFLEFMVSNRGIKAPFKLAYGNETVIPAEVHMANHRVVKYRDKDNKEQLRLNLNLIDEVRMNAEQRTVRYKNLMVRQYDAMVKPKRFNIGDLVLKMVSLATRNPAHGELGPN